MRVRVSVNKKLAIVKVLILSVRTDEIQVKNISISVSPKKNRPESDDQSLSSNSRAPIETLSTEELQKEFIFYVEELNRTLKEKERKSTNNQTTFEQDCQEEDMAKEYF